MLITFGIYRVNYVDLFEVLVLSSLNRISLFFCLLSFIII